MLPSIDSINLNLQDTSDLIDNATIAYASYVAHVSGSAAECFCILMMSCVALLLSARQIVFIDMRKWGYSLCNKRFCSHALVLLALTNLLISGLLSICSFLTNLLASGTEFLLGLLYLIVALPFALNIVCMYMVALAWNVTIRIRQRDRNLVLSNRTAWRPLLWLLPMTGLVFLYIFLPIMVPGFWLSVAIFVVDRLVFAIVTALWSYAVGILLRILVFANFLTILMFCKHMLRYEQEVDERIRSDDLKLALVQNYMHQYQAASYGSAQSSSASSQPHFAYQLASQPFQHSSSPYQTDDSQMSMAHHYKQPSSQEGHSQGTPGRAKFNIDMNLFVIDFKDVKLIEHVAQGGSGAIVFKGKLGQELVAVKVFQTKLLDSTQNFEEFEHELTLLSSLRHRNIINFYGASLDPPRVALVSEWAERGTLTAYIQQNKAKISVRTKLQLLLDIAHGLAYLHSKSVIHRDVKSDNVLLDAKLTAKLTDFGLSRQLDELKVATTKNVGTTNFMAPEIVRGESYNEKVDTYSFAMVMFQLLVEVVDPFLSNKKKFSGNVDVKIATDPGYRPLLPDGFQLPQNLQWYWDLTQRCWDHSPSSRPEFNEIIETLIDHIENDNL